MMNGILEAARNVFTRNKMTKFDVDHFGKTLAVGHHHLHITLLSGDFCNAGKSADDPAVQAGNSASLISKDAAN